MTSTLTLALLPIFLIIALGVLAGLTGRLDNKQVAPLNTLVMDFALPAALFSAVAQTSRHVLATQWSFLLVLTASLLGLWIAIYALQRFVFRLSSGASSVLAISVALPNFAAAGIPLMVAVFGAAGRIEISLAIAIGAVVLSPLTLILLDLDRGLRQAGGRGEAGTQPGAISASIAIRAAVRRVALSPLVIGPCLGVLFACSGLTLPAALARTFTLMGEASAGVALLLTGLVLSRHRPRLTLRVLAAVAISNLVRPALTAALATTLPIGSQMTHAAILLSALPAGFFGLFFALRYGEEINEAASIVAVSTVASVVTLSLAMILTAGMR